MSAKRQLRRRSTEDEPRFVIGMDAHSKKLAISIWDWSDRFNPCLHREIKCMDIEAMVATYERHVDLDSITIIEASTNSANLKRMLNEAGYRAEVVRSDTIANKERKRRICDIVDAENLALAYIKGDVDEFVWTPSDKYAEYRDIMFAYRDTSKEVTRTSNRIWSVCSRKGYKLPIIGAKRMHELGLGTRNQFADAQANLIYGNLPESEKTNEDTAVCRERRAPDSLVWLRAPTSVATLGLGPSPRQGANPLDPRRAAEYVRAISVYARRPLPSKVFSLTPLTQYILDPRSYTSEAFLDITRFQTGLTGFTGLSHTHLLTHSSLKKHFYCRCGKRCRFLPREIDRT